MDSGSARPTDRERVSALLDEWDPIGVYDDADGEWPAGEYSRLVDPVLAMLHRGTDPLALAGYLNRDAGESMGLSAPDDALGVAERLVAWWRSRQDT